MTPGASGGIAILNASSEMMSVHDMPTFKHDGKTIPDIHALTKLLKGVSRITLERVTAYSAQKGGFTFGMTQGAIVASARITNIPVQMVTPQEWQDIQGLKNAEKDTEKKKAQTAAKALTLFPGANLYGPKGGLRDGRSDALLIARRGHLNQLSGEL